MNSRMLTISELAARFAVTKKTIYAMMRRDRAPRAIRVGARLRFRLHDIEVFERLNEARSAQIQGKSGPVRSGRVW